MKILIVEDSPVICERLHNMIAGITDLEMVGDAATEASAIEGIHRQHPDVVILDLTLAEGSGIDVLKQIKKLGLDCKVIIFTNYAYPQYRKKCLQLGADHFIDKSLDLEILGELLISMTQACKPQASNCSH